MRRLEPSIFTDLNSSSVFWFLFITDSSSTDRITDERTVSSVPVSSQRIGMSRASNCGASGFDGVAVDVDVVLLEVEALATVLEPPEAPTACDTGMGLLGGASAVGVLAGVPAALPAGV